MITILYKDYAKQRNEELKEKKIKKKNRKPKIYTKEKIGKRNHECITHLNKVTILLKDKEGLNLDKIDFISLASIQGYNTETLDKIKLDITHNIYPVVGTYKIFVKSEKGTKSEITCVVKKDRNKYHNKKVILNDITFDSDKESKRYIYLKQLEDNNEITDLELQKVFELIPKQSDERAVKYIADFYYKTIDGQAIVEDTKGWATPDYIIKRKLFKYKFKDIVFSEI